VASKRNKVMRSAIIYLYASNALQKKCSMNFG
jgi:hypothetical protein